MVRVNTTIDNINPMITYDSNWSRGNKEEDGESGRYSDGGTFQVSTQAGSTASFRFNGTGVWIFGAKRGNHGPYSVRLVKLDSNTFNFNGFAEPGQFQVPLFSGTVEQGVHDVVITNTQTDDSRPFLDIDFITWESRIGDETESISQTTVQDTDNAFTYTPATAWSTSPDNLTQFGGSTGHEATGSGAIATFDFAGDSVSIFGTVGPTVPSYTVQLDDNQFSNYKGTNKDFAAQVVLYHADNLGPGNHTLKIVNQATSGSPTDGIAIDYAIVSNVPSVAKATLELQNAANPKTSSQSDDDKSGISRAAIGGIVAGIVVVFAIMLGLFFLLRRRKQKKQAAYRHGEPKLDLNLNGQYTGQQYQSDPFSPTTGTTGGATVYRGPSSVGDRSEQSQSTRSAGPISPYENHTASMPASSVRSPTEYIPGVYGGIQHTSHLPNPYGHSSSEGMSSHGNAPMPGMSRTISNPDEGAPAMPRPSLKGEPRALPSVSSASLRGVPENDLRSNRMVVPGRVQDFGPVLQPGDSEEDLLPPNYMQAVEPYRR